MKHFVSITETADEELRRCLDVAAQLKQQLKSTGRNDHLLDGQTLGMLFEKPSLRTRMSFSVAMTQLGGAGIYLREEEVGVDTREPAQDIARILSGMCSGIMARTFKHDTVLTLAKYATVPVINGLTDYSHPCQAMADIMTIEEHFGELKGKKVAYVGDGNNVARSLSVACGKFGLRCILATPTAYALPSDDIDDIMSKLPDMHLETTDDPRHAVADADVIYTDTWVSMGQEQEKQRRIQDFAGFQVNAELLAAAPSNAVVLHCLPAYRGLEITDDVIESDRSLVFQQAENRLHFQKGLLAVLMGSPA